MSSCDRSEFSEPENHSSTRLLRDPAFRLLQSMETSGDAKEMTTETIWI